MNKKVLIWVFVLILLVHIANPRSALNCSIITAGSCGNTAILYLENNSGGYDNAHAENTSWASYANVVCCNIIGGSDTVATNCSDTIFLRLSNGTNAHVQEPSVNTYGSQACISIYNETLGCNYKNKTCGSNETCLLSYASSDWLNLTDAHVASCGYYDRRVCCGTSNYPPTQGTPVIYPTSPTSSQNFTCYNVSTVDPEGNSTTTSIYNWYRNGTPIMVLNMPFDTNFTATDNSTYGVKDYSGNVNNGTLGNSTSGTQPLWNDSSKCVRGGCYTFDGSNDYISLPYSSSLNPTSAVTVTAWIKTTTTANARIVHRYDTDSPWPGYGFSLAPSWDCGTAGQVGFWVGDNTDKFVCTTATVNDGNWRMIAGTFNGSTVNVYIDGVVNATGQRTNGLDETTQKLYIGSEWNVRRYFPGAIDEVRVYNISLSADQIYQLYIEGKNNYTNSTIVANETSVNETWKCEITPNDEQEDGVNKTVSVTIGNAPPTLDNHTLTPTTAYTNDSLELDITCSDNDGDAIKAYWGVYNGSNKINDLTSNITVTSGTETNTQNITEGNLTKHNLWYATVWCNDGTANSSVENTTKINVSNFIPEAPQLTWPPNNYNTTNRTPTFNWTASLDLDVNDSIDTLNYTIVIDCAVCVPIEQTGITTTNYTVSQQLGELDTVYNWTVRAWDGDDNSSWSEVRNFTVVSVSIIEVTGIVEFTTLAPGAVDDTIDDSPTPFIVENDGNVNVNVSIYAQDDLWVTQSINDSSFQYKVANFTAENGSFNFAESNTSAWVNMPGIDSTAAIPAIKVLNYSDVNDRAELEIRVQVPMTEPPSSVSSVIVFQAEASDIS